MYRNREWINNPIIVKGVVTMTYEKARVEVIDFGKTVSFMAFSGGPAGEQQARNAALASAEVATAIAEVGGKCKAEVANSSYDPSTGLWTITVNINNHGGHTKKVVVVIE